MVGDVGNFILFYCCVVLYFVTLHAHCLPSPLLSPLSLTSHIPPLLLLPLSILFSFWECPSWGTGGQGDTLPCAFSACLVPHINCFLPFFFGGGGREALHLSLLLFVQPCLPAHLWKEEDLTFCLPAFASLDLFPFYLSPPS